MRAPTTRRAHSSRSRETGEELSQNPASLGVDLQQLINRRKLVVDYVHVDRAEIEETGAYDLDGLFLPLAHAIDAVGAKRVARTP